MTMRLFMLSPTVVMAARVNQAEFSYPIWQVDFDNITSGSYTAVKENQTVLFGTTPGGDDLGRQRTIATAESDTLYFGRSSRGTKDGEVYLTDNAYITVLDDYRVWAKVPYIDSDGNIFKDGLFAYGDHTENIPPKANAGAGFADTIDPLTGLITVSFSSSESYGLSNSITSVDWDVDDGTITVGTSSSAAITATFPAGFRWVLLTVVDTEAKYHTTAVPVYARDPANDTSIQAFEIERHTIRKDGQELSLKIISDIPESTYPDGTLVMMWEDEPASASDRSHMRFIGWHHTDPAGIRSERTAVLRDVTLDCLDVAGKLRTLPGFPISLEGSATPNSWLKMLEPNMDKYIDYLLRWHSTAFGVANFTLSGTGSDYPFVILGSDGGSIWDQAARRAQALVPDYVLTCDTKGQIAIKPDPIIQAVGDRTATVQTALPEAHWSDMRYTHQRPPRVHWLRSEAVLAHPSTIAALFCVAPDNTPGQGTAEQTQGEKLAISQDDLNTCEGNRYARLNAEESFFSITMARETDNPIEPANLTWVTVTMSAAVAAQRGMTLPTTRGLVHQIDMSYRHEREGLIKTAVLTWERETSGLPATTFIPPATDIPIDYEPLPDSGYDPNPNIVDIGDGFGTVYVMVGDALGRTRDFSASSPAWEDITPSGIGTMLDAILDPWEPRDVMYLVASDGVYRSTDMAAALPTWEIILSSSDANTATGTSTFTNGFAKALASINVDGYLAVFWVGDSNELYCSHTETSKDATPSWVHTLVATTATNFSFRGWAGGADIVPHAVGSPVTLYCTYTTISSTIVVARSTDGGSSWSTEDVTGVFGNKLPYAIHCPYSDNASGDVLALMIYIDNGAARGVYVSVDGGANWTQKYSGSYSLVTRHGVETYTLDRQTAYFVDGGTLYTSDDFYDSYSAATGTGIASTIIATGGFPNQSGQFYCLTAQAAAGAGIYVSTDRGENWVNKTGDWRTVFGTGTAAIGGVPSVIVPLWVTE